MCEAWWWIMRHSPALRSKMLVASTDVTDEGMKHVAGLTGLERLDLSNTDVKDKGLEQIKGLTGLSKTRSTVSEDLALIKRADSGSLSASAGVR